MGCRDMEEKSIKKRRGLKLLGKILMSVTLPMIVLVFLAGVALEAVGSKNSSGLYGEGTKDSSLCDRT